MEKIEILVVGRNPEIVQTVVRLINNNPSWNATPALTDLDAISLFQSRPFTLVLFGGGIEPGSDAMLRKAFTAHNPKITIIQHYGGGSGLLATEINMALDSML
ncbi:MAG: hypothetical protein JST50_01915 [Bacteroidetes bacterium]|jgi:hypothetical protein|nr:hypothetical protein [Bacteroidota bacterium]